MRGRVTILQLLLDHGADWNISTTEGFTNILNFKPNEHIECYSTALSVAIKQYNKSTSIQLKESYGEIIAILTKDRNLLFNSIVLKPKIEERFYSYIRKHTDLLAIQSLVSMERK